MIRQTSLTFSCLRKKRHQAIVSQFADYKKSITLRISRLCREKRYQVIVSQFADHKNLLRYLYLVYVLQNNHTGKVLSCESKQYKTLWSKCIFKLLFVQTALNILASEPTGKHRHYHQNLYYTTLISLQVSTSYLYFVLPKAREKNKSKKSHREMYLTCLRSETRHVDRIENNETTIWVAKWGTNVD